MPNVPRVDAPDAYVPEPADAEGRDIARKINGNLSFGRGVHGERCGNFDAQWIRHVFPATSNVETAVYHTLGRVPIGCIPFLEGAASVFPSRKGSWTDRVIYLKCDAPSVEVLLMVL